MLCIKTSWGGKPKFEHPLGWSENIYFVWHPYKIKMYYSQKHCNKFGAIVHQITVF